MSPFTLVATTALLVAAAAGHGIILQPPPRDVGPAMTKACGAEAVAAVRDDPTTPLEKVTGPLPTCKLDLCRGALFEDNTDKLQRYRPGQVVQMRASIPIPHTGPMNVSIIDTRTNRAIGPPLIRDAAYADEALARLPANNTAFAVTIPNSLPAGRCLQPSQCVLQWFWAGTEAKQSYESCLDFVIIHGNAAAGAGAGRTSPKATSPTSAPSAAHQGSTAQSSTAPVADAHVPGPAGNTTAATVKGAGRLLRERRNRG